MAGSGHAGELVPHFRCQKLNDSIGNTKSSCKLWELRLSLCSIALMRTSLNEQRTKIKFKYFRHLIKIAVNCGSGPLWDDIGKPIGLTKCGRFFVDRGDIGVEFPQSHSLACIDTPRKGNRYLLNCDVRDELYDERRKYDARSSLSNRAPGCRHT